MNRPNPASSNPLLLGGELPDFAAIRPEHVQPAVQEILTGNRARMAALLADGSDCAWDGCLRQIEEMKERLERVWSPVRHLHATADNATLRKAYDACLVDLSAYWVEMKQNRALYDAYSNVARREDFQALGPARRKLVEDALRDFRLAGVALAPNRKKRFRALAERLTRLQSRFEENLMDAGQGWSLRVDDETRLSGLPESVRALARQNARGKGEDGWTLTLDQPCYRPAMEYCEDRSLREEMYEAYVTRASDRGPNAGRWDNGGIMNEIVVLRTETARLLDFPSYAHYSLERKMARSPDEVLRFLHSLAKHARPVAQWELEELRAYARKRHGVTRLEPWDVPYYSTRLFEERYSLSQEALRAYFPVPSVLEGMFEIVRRLYGIEVRPHDRPVPVWHPDVCLYTVSDERGETRGHFYLDLYARAHKRGGAWMDECTSRHRFEDRLQRPIAYLTCNFTPPLEDCPSLLTHEELVTLFHEFGHVLHHLLTLVDHAGVSGINGVPWDAVELPSQFQENWCWEKEALDLTSRHYRDAKPLPAEWIERLRAARNFQAGMQLVRQLEFALFDFRLHHESTPRGRLDIQCLLDEVRSQVAVVVPPCYNRFQNGFSHIFSGGYGAGYYGYLWAEVLAADAYSRFQKEGLFSPQAGRDFLHVFLEQGGVREPLDLFVEFRGREPDSQALLRRFGFDTDAAEASAATRGRVGSR